MNCDLDSSDLENSSYRMSERRRSSGSLYKMNKAERARSLHEKGIDETLAATSLSHVKKTNVKKILWRNALTQKLRIDNEMVLCNMSMEYNKVLRDITERTTISLC